MEEVPRPLEVPEKECQGSIKKSFETKNSRYRDAKRADKISIVRRPLHCEVNPRRLHDEGERDVVELVLTLITPEWICIYLYI